MKENVLLTDVTCRDGLQDEPVFVASTGKIAIFKALVAAGITHIEATSFVHPKWVPQLADAEDVVRMLPHGPRYCALVMNQKGFDRGVAAFRTAGFSTEEFELTFVASASPRHNRANNNRDITESLELFRQMAREAEKQAVQMRGGMACTFTSPWRDEPVLDETVLEIARTYVEAGCKVVNLADTIGTATPDIVARRIAAVQDAVQAEFSLHFHDRDGNAFANIDAALAQGIRRFEGALGGIGGCPFAPDASGNVSIEKALAFFTQRGYATGIDAAALDRAATTLQTALSAAEPVAVPHGAA